MILNYDTDKFAEDLLMYMRVNGLRLVDIEKLTGVNQAVISRLVNFKRKPRTATMAKILPIMGKTFADYL